MTAEWPPVYDPSYVPPDDQEHWSPALETAPPAERDALVAAKLRRQTAWAYERSPFYRKRWGEAGFHPEQFKTLDDLRRIPVITKEDLRRDLLDNPPFGGNVCVDWRDVLRVHGSSGTTGIPTVIAIGKGDWARIGEAHARVEWGAGVRPSDTVFMAAPFSLYMGAWGMLVGAERIGAKCFPFGAGAPGQTRMAVRWCLAARPSVFYGTPSFCLYLAETAQEEGVDPKDFGFRLLFFSGEPGGSIPGTRRALERVYGNPVIVDSGSTGEMTPWMSNGGCRHAPGMHLWQDMVYTQLLDPETREVVPYGGEGVPVYTHLERTSQPLIRFWSGDLASWTDEPCACGRTYPTMPRGIYGRVDDMVVVRGENVYPSAVENVVRATPGLTGEFRVVVSRERTMDELAVLAEYTSEAAESGETERIARRLQSDLGSTLGIRAEVQLKAPGELERTQFKARRVVDERDLHKASAG